MPLPSSSYSALLQRRHIPAPHEAEPALRPLHPQLGIKPHLGLEPVAIPSSQSDGLALTNHRAQVVKRLVEEAEKTSQDMLEALLARLRSNIQLPECLRVVAYLRRLAAFSESELRQTWVSISASPVCREVSDLSL